MPVVVTWDRRKSILVWTNQSPELKSIHFRGSDSAHIHSCVSGLQIKLWPFLSLEVSASLFERAHCTRESCRWKPKYLADSSSNPQADRSYTFCSQLFQINFWNTMSQSDDIIQWMFELLLKKTSECGLIQKSEKRSALKSSYCDLCVQ